MLCTREQVQECFKHKLLYSSTSLTVCLLQRKAWHPLFKLEDLSLETIKRNLDAARAAEAAKELNETGIAAGKQHLILLWCLFVVYHSAGCHASSINIRRDSLRAVDYIVCLIPSDFAGCQT